MARRTRKGWSYLSGEKGRNRVRVFERDSGNLTLEFRDRGERKRISLGHKDPERAKRQADEAATVGRLRCSPGTLDGTGSSAH